MRDGIGRQGFVKLFIIFLLVAAIAFVGISFGKPYYRYNTLRSQTKDILAMELGNNVPEIKKRILAEAAELNVPLDEENLDVTYNASKITKVRASWSEVVDFWGYYQKKIDFVMETEY